MFNITSIFLSFKISSTVNACKLFSLEVFVAKSILISAQATKFILLKYFSAFK